MEKRGYGRRAAVDARATIQSGGRRFQARVTNLGTGGMALETDLAVELDRFLRIQFHLSPETLPVDVDAIVRRRENRTSTVLWGLELVNPSPSTLARIEACLDRQRAPDQPSVLTEADATSDADPAAVGAAKNSELSGLFQSALASLGH